MQYIHLLIVLFFSLGTVKSQYSDAEKFVTQFYAALEDPSTRTDVVSNFFDPTHEPFLLFETQPIQDAAQIQQKFEEAFSDTTTITAKHVTAQPSYDDGFFILVTGMLKQLRFSQVFWLKLVDGELRCQTSIFRVLLAV